MTFGKVPGPHQSIAAAGIDGVEDKDSNGRNPQTDLPDTGGEVASQHQDDTGQGEEVGQKRGLCKYGEGKRIDKKER